MHKKQFRICAMLILIVLLTVYLSEWNVEQSRMEQLKKHTIQSEEYRAQELSEGFLIYLREQEDVGRYVGIYLLEHKADEDKTLYKKWKKEKEWRHYEETTNAIWNDVKFFPIPVSDTGKEWEVTYENSWMYERTYGGQRGHEGTDLMAKKNVRGFCPIVSMTDGIVEQKGWLEKGGYRIGIQSPKGAYFYYAHLDSYADLEIGDTVKAGDILGYMGDSGYGEEGTVGKFPVHLHLGIYIYPEGKEVSVNPYWILRYIENKRVKCYTKI